MIDCFVDFVDCLRKTIAGKCIVTTELVLEKSIRRILATSVMS